MARRRFLKDADLNEESPDFSRLDPGLEPGGEIKPKLGAFATMMVNILKLILGIILLIFVYAGTGGFLAELKLIDKQSQGNFWSGIISFILVYLFVFEPSVIYHKGHKLLAVIFKFFSPLVRVAPYVLPIYTIVVFCLYPLFKLMFSPKDVLGYFVFLGGFSLTLHLVFSAKSLRSRKGDFLKANYIFSFSLIYIINLLLVALCFNLIFEKFSFFNFFNNSYLATREIIQVIFKQIFGA